MTRTLSQSSIPVRTDKTINGNEFHPKLFVLPWINEMKDDIEAVWLLRCI